MAVWYSVPLPTSLYSHWASALWTVTTSTKMIRVNLKVKYSNHSISDWVNTMWVAGEMLSLSLQKEQMPWCYKDMASKERAIYGDTAVKIPGKNKGPWGMKTDHLHLRSADSCIFIPVAATGLTSRWKQLSIWVPKTAVLNEAVIHRSTQIPN